MQRMRKFLHTAVIFSMLMTLVAVAFPATVGAANILINPPSWDFGSVEVGTTSPPISGQNGGLGGISVTNSGVGAVVVDNVIMIAGAQWFDVTANGCLAALLPPNGAGACTFDVVFEPDILGDVQGTIMITFSGPGNPPPSFVTVSGSGVAPVVTYTPAAPFNFGNVQIGSTSAQQVITVKNTGDEEIQFVAPVVSTGNADFDVETVSGFACLLNVPLAPGSECQVRVSVTPTTAGPLNGAVAFFYILNPNAPGPPPGFVTTSYALNATGVFAQISAAPNPVNFGNQLVNSNSAPQPITITNTGIGPVSILNTTLDGPDLGEFIEVMPGGNCELAVLLPGQSCTEYIIFSPTSTGPKAAVLQVNLDNSAGQYPALSYDVQLTGTGTSPTGLVDFQFIDFGSRQVGTVSNPFKVTITNTSAGGYTLPQLIVSPGTGDYALQNDQCSNAFLAAGGTCTFNVVFQPQTAGIKNAAVQISAPGNPTAVQLTGIGVLGNISISPNPVLFPATQVGAESAAIPVTITNNGPGPVTIVSVNEFSAHYDEDGSNCTGQVLTSGQSCSIMVVFTPQVGGPLSRTLFIVLNRGQGNELFTVGLLGTGILNELTISPSGTYNFGNVVVGETALATFTVTNNGASNVGPIPAVVVGPNPPFSVFFDTCSTFTLVPGQSCTIIVQFAPTVPGPVQGVLSVNPVVNLLGNGVSPNGALETNVPQLTFGAVQVGSQSTTQSVIISNNGNVPVTLDAANAVVLSGNDYVVAGGIGTTCQNGLVLDPGVSCIIWVAFQPNGPLGNINETLTVNYTSAGVAAGSLVIALRGIATQVNGAVSPLQLNFGGQEVDTTSGVQTVTFTNTGTGPIVVPQVTIGGPNFDQFLIQTDSCSATVVLPGATCQLSVVFRPTAAGSMDAQLEVGALPNPSIVTLKGIGINPVITMTPAGPVNFGGVIADGAGGNAALQSFTITNTGSNPVTVPAPVITGAGFGFEAWDCAFLNPLGPGASCTLVLRFDPSVVGQHVGTVMVNPVIQLVGQGLSANGALQVNTPQLTFAPQQLGTQSATQQVIVSNNGNVPVTLGAIAVSGEYVLAGGAGNSCLTGLVLAPTESCAFWVAFQPTTAGPNNGVATINYSSIVNAAGVINVLLRGTGITPVLTVDPVQLLFGPQPVNTASVAKKVTVKNSSNGPLTLGNLSVNDADFTIVGDVCSDATLAPNSECTFSVVFLPLGGPGNESGLVSIPVVGLSTVTVVVSGQALAAPQGGVTFTPPFINFGFQQVLNPGEPKPVTLKNTGTSVVTINNIALLTGNTSSFLAPIADDCEGKTLNPGESCTVYVRFRPQTTGPLESQLVYFTNLAGSPHSVYLYGVGITPTLSISPAQLNFGGLQVGVHSAPYTVTVTNTSTTAAVTLDLDGPFTGDFELVGALCNNATLAPLGTCTFQIVFHPTSTGLQSDAIDVEITPGGLNFEVDLVGTGVTPNGTVSPLQLDFGNVQVGTTSIVQTVRFTNTGSGPVTVPPIHLAGPDAANFLIQTDGCSNATVDSGKWCEVSVVFRPQTQGPKNAQLSIGLAPNPDVVTLKGNGQVPSPQFDAAAVDFGLQPLMVESVARRITVTNIGNGDLLLIGQITDASIGGTNAGDFHVKVSTCNDRTLAKNESCYVDVTFKPLAPLKPDPDIRSGYLTFITNLPTPAQLVPLTGQVGQFNVNVNVGNNACQSVALSPAGPYAGTDEVTATATIPANNVFIGWYLDGYYVGFSNPIDFKMKNSSHTLEAICVAKPTFNDIAGSPYISQIEQMAAHGFIKGYQGLSGPYGPNDNVLRDQIAVMITRMANRTNGWNTESAPNPFTDQCNNDGCVEPELWNAVAVGFQKGVIAGVGNGQFAPFANVTEIQVVAFTGRAMVAITHELEARGRYPACPDAPIPAPPVATVSPCPTPPNLLSGTEGVLPATKWEKQLNNVTIYGDVTTASGHRIDISTYFYYVGGVPGPNGTTIGPATAWPTWTTPAKRQQVAAIMWAAFADYWGVDRIDEAP